MADAAFVPREQRRESPEVHVAGLCIDRHAHPGLRLLIARRSPDRQLFPGRWEGCGGQLAAGETFEEGVARHFLGEMGIRVRVLAPHCFYVIREPGQPVIPGIRFLCERADDREPRSVRHTDLRWVTEQQFRELPPESFVGNLQDEVLALLQIKLD